MKPVAHLSWLSSKPQWYMDLCFIKYLLQMYADIPDFSQGDGDLNLGLHAFSLQAPYL